MVENKIWLMTGIFVIGAAIVKKEKKKNKFLCLKYLKMQVSQLIIRQDTQFQFKQNPTRIKQSVRFKQREVN